MTMAYNPSRRAVTGYVSALGLALGAPNASASLADAELLALGVRYDAACRTVIEAGKAGDYPDDFHFVDTEVAEQMIKVPARTAAGLKVKVRALFSELGLPDRLWGHPKNWEYGEGNVGLGLTLALMEDILNL
jgi:hypothetical protein